MPVGGDLIRRIDYSQIWGEACAERKPQPILCQKRRPPLRGIIGQ
jgi:hypothetical protein